MNVCVCEIWVHWMRLFCHQSNGHKVSACTKCPPLLVLPPFVFDFDWIVVYLPQIAVRLSSLCHIPSSTKFTCLQRASEDAWLCLFVIVYFITRAYLRSQRCCLSEWFVCVCVKVGADLVSNLFVDQTRNFRCTTLPFTLAYDLVLKATINTVSTYNQRLTQTWMECNNPANIPLLRAPRNDVVMTPLKYSSARWF